MGENWPRKLHRVADRVDRRFGRAIRRVAALESLWVGLLDGIVAQQSDRRDMRREILPALARLRPSRILFVGVRGYTRGYGDAFVGLPTEFWTCDIDPAAAVHGAPDRHVTEDVRRLDCAFPAGFFAVAIINGVFGWGVDTVADIDRVLVATERILGPGGILLIGWNTDRAPDPDSSPAIRLFEPVAFSGLPHRKRFVDVTHVYAWYRTLR